MKKTVLALILSSSLFLTACEDKNATTEIAKLKTEIATLTADLAQAKAELPALNVEIIPFFQKSETLKDKGEEEMGKVYRFISLAKTNVQWLDDLLFKNTYENLTASEENKPKLAVGTEAKAALLQHLTQNYEESLNFIKENIKEGIGGAMNSDMFSLETHFIGQRGNIAVFSQFNNTYTGGAHGMYATDYINVDLASKKIIHFNDLIPRENEAEVRKLLWKAYEYRSNADGNGETFTKPEDFNVSQNFLLTDDGVQFVYPPYALGPFVEGEITLTLSWYEVNTLLNPAYQRTKKDGFGLNPNNDF